MTMVNHGKTHSRANWFCLFSSDWVCRGTDSYFTLENLIRDNEKDISERGSNLLSFCVIFFENGWLMMSGIFIYTMGRVFTGRLLIQK